MESVLTDESVLQAAIDDYTETYGRVKQDIERLQKFANLIDIFTVPAKTKLPTLPPLNILLNDLRTLERRLKQYEKLRRAAGGGEELR